jgi:hypothetical protein
MPNSRLVQTSRGWLEVNLYDFRLGGFTVSVRSFDGDGWEVGEKQSWTENSDETLAQFLSSSVDLAEPEASELAARIQGSGWMASSDHSERTRYLDKMAVKGIIVLSLVVLLALMGVAFVVWLIVT